VFHIEEDDDTKLERNHKAQLRYYNWTMLILNVLLQLFWNTFIK